MGKKSRAKAKAKRFGEGSARAAVDDSTYGAGNAFGSAFVSSTVVDPVRGTNSRGQRELLVVDGYNVIHATSSSSSTAPMTRIPTTSTTAPAPRSSQTWPRSRSAVMML